MEVTKTVFEESNPISKVVKSMIPVTPKLSNILSEGVSPMSKVVESFTFPFSDICTNISKCLFDSVFGLREVIDNVSYWEDIGINYGQRGWAVLGNIGAGEVTTWLTISDIDEFDQKMSGCFLGGLNSETVITMYDNANINSHLKEIFKQSYKAFELELYYPAITSLTSMFDGLLADVSGYSGWHSVKYEKGIDILRKGTKQQRGLNLANIIALQEFNKIFTCSTAFTEPEPVSLNRHWLMHGRMKSKLKIFDYIKLLSFVDILVKWATQIEVSEELDS